MTVTVLPWRADGADLWAKAPPEARWCTGIRRLRLDGDREVTTNDEETCALLLAGTFDLVGNGTAWQSRGARTEPTQGRPVAVFLPPRATFAAHNGRGDILLLAARQPPAPAATGRQALQQSPLLPLAGSGKAFDPEAGAWRPAETFPTAAESLPPRRIARVRAGAVSVERVFGADYKAATLCVDELVLPAGAAFAAAELALPDAAVECLVYSRSTAPLQLAVGDATVRLMDEAAAFVDTPRSLRLVAGTAPAYVAIAWAGKRSAAD